MQRLVPVALLVFLGLLSIDHCVATTDRRARDAAGALPHVTVFSTGLGLAGPIGLQAQGLAGIRLGDLHLADEDAGDGLRVAAFWGDGTLLDFRTCAAPQEPERASLAEFCAEQLPGTFLAAASRGSLRPQGSGAEARSAALAGLLAKLGAQAAPWKALSSSWAMVARRDPDGWVCLGEAYSERAGVALTVPLAPAATAEGAPRLLDTTSAGVTALVATWRSGPEAAGITPVRGLNLLDGGLDALVAAPGAGPVAWEHVEVAPRSALSLHVAPGVGAALGDRVLVVVRVDGEEVARRELVVDLDRRYRWQPWEIDLAAPVGRTVRLELGLAPGHEHFGAVWGAPVVAPR